MSDTVSGSDAVAKPVTVASTDDTAAQSRDVVTKEQTEKDRGCSKEPMLVCSYSEKVKSNLTSKIKAANSSTEPHKNWVENLGFDKDVDVKKTERPGAYDKLKNWRLQSGGEGIIRHHGNQNFERKSQSGYKEKRREQPSPGSKFSPQESRVQRIESKGKSSDCQVETGVSCVDTSRVSQRQKNQQSLKKETGNADKGDMDRFGIRYKKPMNHQAVLKKNNCKFAGTQEGRNEITSRESPRNNWHLEAKETIPRKGLARDLPLKETSSVTTVTSAIPLSRIHPNQSETESSEKLQKPAVLSYSAVLMAKPKVIHSPNIS